jgi:hypothetical protein
VEQLETRAVPAGPSWAQQFSPDNVIPGNVLNAAPDLTLQSAFGGGGASVLRDLVNGQIASGTADVNWYRLTLNSTASVTLTTFDRAGSSFAGVISLYNNDPDALVQNVGADGLTLYSNDPLDPVGHRLLAQATGTASGGTSLTWNLAAGTYYIAVSGAGNQYFHPFIADSGLPGSSGAYGLTIEADSLNVGVPVVLEANPADGSVLASTPLVLRLDLNQGIDPNSFVLNQPSGNTIQLLYSADGSFTTGVQSIFLQAHFSPPANDPISPGADELQLTPWAPLQDGFYRLFLQGIGTLASPNTDTTTHFQVASGMGLAGDDTAATSHNLGDLSNGNLVQVAGAIGTDPYYSFYDPNNPNPSYPGFAFPSNYAGADVNMYHFSISTPGNYIFLAEAFAGRIGSPLDPGLSLFQIQGNQFNLLAANDNTLNNLAAFGDNGYSGLPLINDSFLSIGLQTGNYYLAVSSGPNTPDRFQNHFAGVGDVFTPVVAHSGSSGFNNADALTIGPYVLNLLVAANPGAPHVVAVGTENSLTAAAATPLTSGAIIASPSYLVVHFDQAMNVQQLAYTEFQVGTQYTLPGIYVQAPNGYQYFPRLISYDPTTSTAVLQFLDALPNGVNQLHLSGSSGLTNLGGTALAGNSAGGDYVLSFTVQGSPTGAGSAFSITNQEPNDTLATAQNLGTLFPTMQQAGIAIVRNLSNAGAVPAADTADYYMFQVAQTRQYTFTLTGSGLPAGIYPSLTPLSPFDSINPPSVIFLNGAAVVTTILNANKWYAIGLGGWTPAQAPNVAYKLFVTIGQVGDNPTPLTVGAAPAISIRLVNGGSTTTPVVVLPNGGTTILPVSLTTGNSLPSLANLLPNSVLASGAVGGIAGSSGAEVSDLNAVVQLSGSSSLDDLIQLIVLTQLNDLAGNSETDAQPLPTWVESLTSPVQEGLEKVLDWTYRLTDWLNQSPAPPLGADSGGESESTEMEDADNLEALFNRSARTAMPDPFAAPGDFEEPTWVGALAALALCHGDTQRRRGQIRTAWQRTTARETVVST